jgi:hypothetical protein
MRGRARQTVACTLRVFSSGSAAAAIQRMGSAGSRDAHLWSARTWAGAVHAAMLVTAASRPSAAAGPLLVGGYATGYPHLGGAVGQDGLSYGHSVARESIWRSNTTGAVHYRPVYRKPTFLSVAGVDGLAGAASDAPPAAPVPPHSALLLRLAARSCAFPAGARGNHAPVGRTFFLRKRVYLRGRLRLLRYTFYCARSRCGLHANAPAA